MANHYIFFRKAFVYETLKLAINRRLNLWTKSKCQESNVVTKLLCDGIHNLHSRLMEIIT